MLEKLLAILEKYKNNPKTLYIELKKALDNEIAPLNAKIKELETQKAGLKEKLDALNGNTLKFSQKKTEILRILNNARLIVESKSASRRVKTQFMALYKEHKLALDELEKEFKATEQQTETQKAELQKQIADIDNQIKQTQDEITKLNTTYTEFIKKNQVTEYTDNGLLEGERLLYIAVTSKQLKLRSQIASQIEIKKENGVWQFAKDSAKNKNFDAGLFATVDFKASSKEDVKNGFTLDLFWDMAFSKNEFEITSGTSEENSTSSESTKENSKTTSNTQSYTNTCEDSETDEESNGSSKSKTNENSTTDENGSSHTVGGSVKVGASATVSADFAITSAEATVSTEVEGHYDYQKTYNNSKTNTNSNTDETNHNKTKSKSQTHSDSHTNETTNEETNTTSNTTGKSKTTGKESGDRQMFSLEGSKSTFSLKYIFQTNEDGSLSAKLVGPSDKTVSIKDMEIVFSIDDSQFK